MLNLAVMKASPIRCLVSAGPTREFFDPVRFISNPSTGKMGYALAEAAAARGWEVELVSGPVSLEAPTGVKRSLIVTGADLLDALQTRFAACDVLIMTAAVMDYRPRHKAPRKIKKSALERVLEMEPVPDILATLAQARRSDQVLVGFAAETDQLDLHAREKLAAKGADFIVANTIGGPECAFGRDSNTVHVYSKDASVLKLGPLPKRALADRLLDILERSFSQIQPSR